MEVRPHPVIKQLGDTKRESWNAGAGRHAGSVAAASMLFGGLGIFFLYYSYSDPMLSTYGLIFIGSASGIVWSTGG